MLLLPTWLTMMCTVLYRLLYYGLIKGTACTYGFISLSILLSLGETVGKQGWNVFRSVEHLLPPSDVGVKKSFLMWMVLHQELIGWCSIANSAWCIAFSIERSIKNNWLSKMHWTSMLPIKKKGLTFITMAKTLSRFKENVTCTNCSMSEEKIWSDVTWVILLF